ncbi:hypothetical protein M3J09_012830 [Ascochyta lentis]
MTLEQSHHERPHICGVKARLYSYHCSLSTRSMRRVSLYRKLILWPSLVLQILTLELSNGNVFTTVIS